MKTRFGSLILAAALSLAMVAPAAASTGGGHETRVSYSGLNLSSAAGADTFINRLRQSARMTCGDRMGQMPLSEHRRIRTCSSAFVQNGVISAENTTVAARFIARGGHLPAVVIASSP